MPPQQQGQHQVYRVNLLDSIEAWRNDFKGNDIYHYLEVGRNYSEGRGIVSYCEECEPKGFKPWNFWAPGTPILFGTVFKLSHIFGFSSPMQILYFVSWVLLFVTALITLGTISVYTQNFWALFLGSLFLGWAPPLQDWHYGKLFANSEMGTLVPMALCMCFLALGFRRFWNSQLLNRKTLIYFSLSGFFLGLVSVVRAANVNFAFAVCVFTFVLALIRLGRTPTVLIRVASICFAFYLCFQIFPTFARTWNYHRVGQYKIFDGTSWRFGFWHPHRSADWIFSTGIGIGHFLNPEKAGPLYSNPNLPRGTYAKEFIKEFFKHPIQASLYRIKRFPLLYLGFSGLPNPNAPVPPPDVIPELGDTKAWKLWFESLWDQCLYTILVYFILAIYFLSCFIRRVWPPEVVYFYLIFLVAASPFVHAEFRYTFPALHFVRLAVPLLFLSLLAHWGFGHRPEDRAMISLEEVDFSWMQRLAERWRHFRLGHNS